MLRSSCLALAAVLFAGLSAGCDKVQQCNKLINAINAQHPKLEGATKELATVEANPAVVDAYTKVLDDAIAAVNGLEFRDEKVAAFGKRYEALLEDAKTIGPAVEEALKDPEKASSLQTQFEKLPEAENKLVAEVNAYCGGSE